ncbi:MAG: hypothetical protein JO142_00170 [Burkholderiales bacterium]|nr:hypothetical protein [Burkholderiales bacterium]
MKSWINSFYAKLVLALLVALAASYSSMYWIFESDAIAREERADATVMAAKVLLLQEFLEAHATDSPPLIDGMRVADTPTPTPIPADAQVEGRAARLAINMRNELGRDVQVRMTTLPKPGFWFDLVPDDTQGSPVEPRKWLFVPMPRHNSVARAIALPMLFGFVLFFLCGIWLLWRIQAPLQRLSAALLTVGRGSRPTPVDIDGDGIVATVGDQYNDMVARLDQQERDRAVMLAGIAHDLRTPITRLRLLTEVAQIDRRTEFVAQLRELDEIVDQFLFFSSGSEGEPIEMREMGTFVREIVAPYRDRGVDYVPSDTEYPAVIHPNGLKRALVNLIENALEYGKMPVTVVTGTDGTHVAITVSDCGDGIADNLIDSAVRPFTRLDTSRGGNAHCGLGLAIAAKIAEEHGGSLVLRNRSNGGLEATLRIAISNPAARQAQLSAQTPTTSHYAKEASS